MLASSSWLGEDFIAGYRLLREIHRGGQGVVYQALQLSTRRKVAIKVLRDGSFGGSMDQLRFEREVRILSQLRHGLGMTRCRGVAELRSKLLRYRSAAGSCKRGYGQLHDRRKRAAMYGLTCKCGLAYNVPSRCMDDLYRAIADPTRRAILDELVERDGQSLFELCGRLTMKHGIGSSRQAISQHLEVLESAGLVVVRREGRYKFHWFNAEPLKAISKRWPASGKRR